MFAASDHLHLASSQCRSVPFPCLLCPKLFPVRQSSPFPDISPRRSSISNVIASVGAVFESTVDGQRSTPVVALVFCPWLMASQPSSISFTVIAQRCPPPSSTNMFSLFPASHHSVLTPSQNHSSLLPRPNCPIPSPICHSSPFTKNTRRFSMSLRQSPKVAALVSLSISVSAPNHPDILV